MVPGSVIAVRGSVVDVRFAADLLPGIDERLAVAWDRPHRLILEVHAHLDPGSVRTVAMQGTAGLRRFTPAHRLGGPITVPAFGQMNEPPGARLRTGATALTVAEHFRDAMGREVLLLMDDVFRVVQAGTEISGLLGRLPSRVGYQPTLATEVAGLEAAHRLHRRGGPHLDPGGLRARRRFHRSGRGRDLRVSGQRHRAVALDGGGEALDGGRPAGLLLDPARPRGGRPAPF
ncbi:hypothetical protein SH611_05750 [Geminicoccaceae bacterium 1502E]|nr:hypothetical protein [Geminicoccaceae bacterium 1502E]